MNVDDQLRLAKLIFQPLVLALQLRQFVGQRVLGFRFATTPLPRQRRKDALLALLPPRRQMGRIEPFPPQLLTPLTRSDPPLRESAACTPRQTASARAFGVPPGQPLPQSPDRLLVIDLSSPTSSPSTVINEEVVVSLMLAQRGTSDAVYLRTAQLAEIRIPRGEVDEMNRSHVSTMPQGLEKGTD